MHFVEISTLFTINLLLYSAVLHNIWYAIYLALQSDYCQQYHNCEHRLEAVQRKCVLLDKKHKVPRGKNDCFREIEEIQEAVDGFELRRSELERDCARKNATAEIEKLTYHQVTYLTASFYS